MQIADGQSRLHQSICALLQLSALGDQLSDLYQTTGGAVVLFIWVQFLKEDALRFLDIHALLELPSDEHSTEDPSHVALSEPRDNKHTSDPGRTDTLQTSEFKADNQSDPSSEAGKSKPLPAAQSDQSEQEDFLHGEGVSDSLLLPSSSSETLHQTAPGAASLPREAPPNGDQTLSGLSLTLSQALLSQLLIYDADQRHKQFATTVFDCGVCFMGCLGSDCVQLPECAHIFCQACLGQFCKLQITEGNVRGVTCPQADCTATPTPAQVQS